MILVSKVDALLPQTQCGECGYAGCLPYAQALVLGEVGIDRCPPGGEETVIALGQLLNRDVDAVLKSKPFEKREPSKAIIREDECIGCTKCIQACPVDAIIGSSKRMHAIIEHECTGCGLCVPACPVDCIDMEALPEPLYNPDTAREHHQERAKRLLRIEHERQQLYREKKRLAMKTPEAQQDIKSKQDFIKQALARKLGTSGE